MQAAFLEWIQAREKTARRNLLLLTRITHQNLPYSMMSKQITSGFKMVVTNYTGKNENFKCFSHNPSFSQYYTAIIFLTPLSCVKLYSWQYIHIMHPQFHTNLWFKERDGGGGGGEDWSSPCKYCTSICRFKSSPVIHKFLANYITCLPLLAICTWHRIWTQMWNLVYLQCNHSCYSTRTKRSVPEDIGERVCAEIVTHSTLQWHR